METQIFNSPLVNAAKRGNLDDVEKISEAFEDLEERKREYYLSLYIAAYQGHENIVKTLLSKGADPNYCFNDFLPPLHAAAQKGRVSVAQILLEHGAEVNPKLKNYSGSKSVELEETDYFSTPLLTAARGGHEKMVNCLLSHGANIEAKLGSTPLKITDEIGRIFAFGDYRDSEIQAKNSKLGFRPLHFAVYSGDKYVVQLLLKHGADVNSKSEENMTPLYVSIMMDTESITKILVEAGGDLNLIVQGLSLYGHFILRKSFSLKKNQNKNKKSSCFSNERNDEYESDDEEKKI